MGRNPIIQRELLSMLREPRTLLLQVALVVGLALLVMLRWPSEGQVDLTGSQSIQVLRIFGYGLLVGLILLSPIFPATSFVRERQQGTLILLLMTPMSRLQMLWGKIAAACGFILLLVVLSLPAAAACYTMGGVGLGQVVFIYAVLVSVAIQYASLGLLVGTYAGSTDASLRITYGLMLLLAVGSLGPHQFLQAQLAGPLALAIDWLRCLSPVPAMLELLGQIGVAERGTQGAGNLTGRYLVLAWGSALLCLGWTFSRLNQRIFDKAHDKGTMTEDRTAGQRAYRRFMFLYDPQRRRKLIPGWINPVLVKEFRTRRFGRTHWILRLFAVCLVLSLGLMLAITRSSETWGVVTLGAIVVLLQMALVILLTPSLACGLVSGELESGGWPLLQMTGIHPLRIVIGKLMSVFWTLFMVLLATLPACAVMILIDKTQAERLAWMLVTVALTATWAVLLSAAVSSCFRRTAPATATAYTLLVLQCAATFLFWIGRDRSAEQGPEEALAGPVAAPWFAHETIERVLSINPVAAALHQIGAPGFENFQLLPTAWWLLGAGAVCCVGVLGVRVWQLSKPS